MDRGWPAYVSVMGGTAPLDMYPGGMFGGMPLMLGGDIETTPCVGLEAVDRDLTRAAALLENRRVGDMLADRCCWGCCC